MRLLVLGGGSCQLNLIKRAKERGHFVILIDCLPFCPGSALSDVHVKVSTFDLDGVIKAAQDYNAEGVITLGTDQPVLIAARASEAAGLSFYIDGVTAESVTNKRIMKDIFKKNAIPSVKYRLIKKDFQAAELKDMRFPAVLKPVDNQGQRGIFLVQNASEVRGRIAETLSFSREDKALLEEFYESDEITVNGWVSNNEVKIISVVDRVTMKGTSHIGICLCHNYPSVYMPSHYEKILTLTQHIVRAFDIHEGPIYFQYLIGRDGMKVNEIAMRIGGAYEDVTIPIISGIDILGMLFETIETGYCDTQVLDDFDPRQNRICLSTQLFFCKPGKITSMTPLEKILALPAVRDMHYAYKEGDEIPEIENATARAGYIIIEGRNFEDMIFNVNKVFDQIVVSDHNNDNLVIKYKDYTDKYVIWDSMH